MALPLNLQFANCHPERGFKDLELCKFLGLFPAIFMSYVMWKTTAYSSFCYLTPSCNAKSTIHFYENPSPMVRPPFTTVIRWSTNRTHWKCYSTISNVNVRGWIQCKSLTCDNASLLQPTVKALYIGVYINMWQIFDHKVQYVTRKILTVGQVNTINCSLLLAIYKGLWSPWDKWQEVPT